MCSMMRLACSLAFLVQEAEGAAAFFPYAFAIESSGSTIRQEGRQHDIGVE